MWAHYPELRANPTQAFLETVQRPISGNVCDGLKG